MENIPAMSSLALADEKEAASHTTTAGVGFACFRLFGINHTNDCSAVCGYAVLRDSFIFLDVRGVDSMVSRL